jgi:hypothetical protein
MILLLLAQSVLPEVSDKAVQKALSKAQPVAVCQVGPDCEQRWARAREWVHENSRFSIVRDNDHEILTRFAIYANTDASYAVALDAGLLILVLSEAFRIGVALREDNEAIV